MSIHLNSGQHCQANSRVFVHESIATEFTEALVKLMTSRSIGDPADKSVFQGPQGDKIQKERIVSILEQGKKDGTVLCGGKAADVNGKVRPLHDNGSIFAYKLWLTPSRLVGPLHRADHHQRRGGRLDPRNRGDLRSRRNRQHVQDRRGGAGACKQHRVRTVQCVATKFPVSPLLLSISADRFPPH